MLADVGTFYPALNDSKEDINPSSLLNAIQDPNFLNPKSKAKKTRKMSELPTTTQFGTMTPIKERQPDVVHQLPLTSLGQPVMAQQQMAMTSLPPL